MGKRKTSAPKRASDEKRQFMTWSMIDGATSSGSLSVINDNDPTLLNEWERGSQVTLNELDKKEVGQVSVINCSFNSLTSDLDDVFNLYLENCLYCVTILNKLAVKEGEWCCELGRFIIRLSPESSFLAIPLVDLPPCEECWLYVAGADGKSMIYFEMQQNNIENVKDAGKKSKKQTISMFWCVDIDLPLSCLEGLQVKSFQVVRGQYDGCNQTLQLIIYAKESILLHPKFSSEPIRPKKSHLALQELMRHFYGFSPTFSYDGLTSSKKHDIEHLYAAVMERQSRHEICHDVDVQHPSLKPLLRPYQRDSVHWMLHQERYKAKKDARNTGLHQLYEEVSMKDGKTLYYNKHCGSLIEKRPLSSDWPPGGILADEMGLGKTVEVLCCMMLHPRGHLPLPDRLHTLSDEQEMDREEMDGIVDNPASVNSYQSDNSGVANQPIVLDQNIKEITEIPVRICDSVVDNNSVSNQSIVVENIQEIHETPVSTSESVVDKNNVSNQSIVLENIQEIQETPVSTCESVVDNSSVSNQLIVLKNIQEIHETPVSICEYVHVDNSILNQRIVPDQNIEEVGVTKIGICDSESVLDDGSIGNQALVADPITEEATLKTVSITDTVPDPCQYVQFKDKIVIPEVACESVQFEDSTVMSEYSVDALIDKSEIPSNSCNILECAIPNERCSNQHKHDDLNTCHQDKTKIVTSDLNVDLDQTSSSEKQVLAAKLEPGDCNDRIPVLNKDQWSVSVIESSKNVLAVEFSCNKMADTLCSEIHLVQQDDPNPDESINDTHTILTDESGEPCVNSSGSSLCFVGLAQSSSSDISESCKQEDGGQGCEFVKQRSDDICDQKCHHLCFEDNASKKQTESDFCNIKEDNLLNVSSEKTNPCDDKTEQSKETNSCVNDNGLKIPLVHNELQQVAKPHKNIFSSTAVTQRAFFECICGSRDGGSEDLLTVQCVMCSLWQHAKCMKYDLNNPYRGEYKCPHCHVICPPIPSGATLIISPASISHQWEEEIQKHIKKESLKVFVYTGVNKLGYIQPQTLASYDIVITMYETLRKEIDYVDLPHSNSETGRRFRHPKRFMAIPSPIISVEWWRICLDEAQMVECTTTKTADMALRLTAVNRWCVTGTPIQKSVEDLYGLVLFLGMDPYWVQQWWKKLLYEPFCYGVDSPMYDTLSQVLWRTAKKDVLDQIQLPSQTEQVHWLTFSPVEDHFYRRQFRDCVKVSMQNLSKWSDSSTRLSSLDRHTMSQLLHPLLKLRQACCHPQAVRGEFLPIHKSTLTMEELLESLTKKAKVECEEAHRQLVAALNGLAAIHMIKLEYVEAVDKYREVLRSVEEHKNELRTDDLQQLHAMHNLHEVLSVKPTGVDPTLRDDQLVQQSEDLRQKYMLKVGSKVQSAMENLLPVQANIRDLKAEFADGSDWWNELLDWVKSHQLDDVIMERIREDLSDTHEMNSMLYRFRDLRGLEYLLYSQLSALDSFHTKLVSKVISISDKPSQETVNKTVECCLRPEANILKTCPFCEVDELFNEYESKLFSFVERGLSTASDGDDSLYQVHTRRQGTWADSELESVIKAIYNFGRIHRLPPEYKEMLEYGNTHIKLFDTLKKEFKHLRNVWLAAREQVSSLDELDMATTRLRVRLPDEPVSETPQPHVLEKGHVDLQRMKLLGEKATGSSDLRKRLGQLVYLQNLAKTQIGTEGDGLNPEPCPICQRELGAEWSVLQCCHCFCLDCIRVMVDNFSFGGRHRSVKCALCRQSTRHGEISYVSTKKSNQTDDDISVKGSHSTKVEAVVKCLLQIHKTDPQAKALVFSTWQDVLGIIEQALAENNISSLSLHTPGKFQKNLTSFREDDITALLLPVHSGSNGLNLIEATHVLLVEPILNPAQELQAVGRVHRIGQTRPTKIHHFLVRGTIEERINTMVKSISESPDLHDTSELALTIGQLTSLFQEEVDDVPVEDEPATSNDSPLLI